MLTFILTGVTFYIIRNITKSPFGRILIALSEDEIFAQSLGKTSIPPKSFASRLVPCSLPFQVYYMHTTSVT